MSGTPILHTHEERQAAIDQFRAEGKSPAWVYGWWRREMRRVDEKRYLSTSDASDRSVPPRTPGL
jgi:hypothetical protein